jgi:hypothetical protein
MGYRASCLSILESKIFLLPNMHIAQRIFVKETAFANFVNTLHVHIYR